nr:hypothetical protein [Tanacetum cinerariifolium]
MQGEEMSKGLTVSLMLNHWPSLHVEPLAITTTTTFEVSHKDAYDSNVDEGPHAVVIFMANLKQTGPSTGEGSSNDTNFHSDVQTYDNHFFDNLNHQVSQEMHQGKQLDSDVDSVIDAHDNTIPYHQYQLNNKVESDPTDVSSFLPGGIFVITILDDLRVYDSEETLVQGEDYPDCKVSQIVIHKSSHPQLHFGNPVSKSYRLTFSFGLPHKWP